MRNLIDETIENILVIFNSGMIGEIIEKQKFRERIRFGLSDLIDDAFEQMKKDKLIVFHRKGDSVRLNDLGIEVMRIGYVKWKEEVRQKKIEDRKLRKETHWLIKGLVLALISGVIAIGIWELKQTMSKTTQTKSIESTDTTSVNTPKK